MTDLAPETLELLQRVSTDTITGLLMKLGGCARARFVT